MTSRSFFEPCDVHHLLVEEKKWMEFLFLKGGVCMRSWLQDITETFGFNDASLAFFKVNVNVFIPCQDFSTNERQEGSLVKPVL